VAAVLLLVLVPVGSGSVGTSAPAPTAAITELSSSLVFAAPFGERAGYSASYATMTADPEPASGSVLVVVTFEPTNSALFDPPASGAPALTVTQVANEFGLAPATYASVLQYFVAQGLTVVHAWPDRLAVTVEGPAATVGRAFGTTIESGLYDGGPATYPAQSPTLPPSIEPMVGSVLGLSTGFTTFSLPLGAAAVEAPGASSSTVSPAIARNIYDLSDLYNLSGGPTFATKESIALLLWGDGYAPSDLSTFYAQYYPTGFPAPTINAYPVDGAPEPSASAPSDPDSAAPQELTLDLEWSGSMAPGATLDAVYAPDGTAPSYSPTSATMADALHQAISLDPTAISMSFGTAEASDASLAAAWGTYLAEANQEGIALLAATGDLGGSADSNCGGGPSPEYPSTSPDVIAVGGTDVSLDQNLLGQVTGFSESAWSMSGGGFSTNRGVPDVSATAALNFLYYNGQEQTAAGTSFATPLWAGLVTELTSVHGSSLGFLPPRLYTIGAEEPSGKIGTGLADITTGSNCVASAGPGWDAATGWGSPRAGVLYEELTATFVNLSISASPTATAPGGSITISAHLANGTTNAPIEGVTIDVALAADESFGPCTGSFGSAAPVTNAEGNVSVTLGVPWCYLGSHAVADASVTSGGLYGVNSTTVGVDLLAFAPFLAGITSYPANVAAFVVILAIAIAIGVAISSRYPRTRAAAPSARVVEPVAPPVAAAPAPEPPPPAPDAPESPSPLERPPLPGPDAAPDASSGDTSPPS
jgi:kumamolisin